MYINIHMSKKGKRKKIPQNIMEEYKSGALLCSDL